MSFTNSKALSKGQVYDLLYSKRPYKQQAHQIYEIIKKHFGLSRDPKEQEILESQSSQTDFLKNMKTNYDQESRSNSQVEKLSDVRQRSLSMPLEKIELLDLGCGTGLHLRELSKFPRLEVSGLDLDEEHLAQAKIHVPKAVEFYHSDMADFSLEGGKQFDVIICLFSAVGYMRTVENLMKLLRSIRRLLREGGLVIIEPWFHFDFFREGQPLADFRETNNIKLCRMAISKRLNSKEGPISHLEFTTTLAVRNAPDVEIFRDVHILGLWTREQYQEAFLKAGITVKYTQDIPFFEDRGLYVGRDPGYTKHHLKYCKLICTGDWTSQLNYLTERGWNIVEFLSETESKYRELDDYGKKLIPEKKNQPSQNQNFFQIGMNRKFSPTLGIGWYDVRQQVILLQREEEELI